MADQTTSKRLYDLLVTKNFDIQALDSKTGRAPANEQGQPDINEADEFRFDFTTESNKNYGSVVVLLGDDNDLTMFFGDTVGKTMEGADKKEWFDFLYQMKQFATKNFLSFSPENITKLKYTKQGQAAIKEGLFESWQGRGDLSWNGATTEARLLIKHKKKLGESDARFRYIESIYVETAEGERFKLKSRSLTAGKAMLEHVRQGGNPYDARGQHINEIVEELSVLSRFRRANSGKILEGETKNLVEQTDSYYKNMHSVLKHLGTQRGYQSYFESWSPATVDAGNLVVEDLKNLFITQTIDHRIEEALPLLARITQEANSMKEAQIFESWINRLVEGTWAIPETPEQKQTLVDLMSKEFPVGADAVNATEQLYDVFGDDELFDRLQELADADANADARSVVMTRMQELSDNPDVEAVIGQLQTTNPAEPAADPDAMAQDVEGDEQLPQNVEEGIGGIGNAIKSLYQKIYAAGDDEIEYFYNDSPIFAQYWDEYEGDLDSIIAEVDPGELQVILDELESYVQNANLAEGSEEVDTHGRTKAEWVKAVHAKYPMARVIHNKDNTQVMAVLPNGKEIRWIKDEGIIEQGIAEAGFTKTPSGDYINQHTGVRSSKPPVKKKRGEKTGAEWDAIEKAKKDKEQGVAEGATPASTSKVLRLIQRHRPDWFDNYGVGEVEDTVVDMAEMGKFQGMSAVDALALVGQELESLYGQQGVAEEKCPEHGLKECGIYEYTGNWTNFGLEESDQLTQLKRLALGK